MNMLKFMKWFLKNKTEICKELNVSDEYIYCPYLQVTYHDGLERLRRNENERPLL